MSDHKKWMKNICKKPYILDKLPKIPKMKKSEVNMTPQATGGSYSPWKQQLQREENLRLKGRQGNLKLRQMKRPKRKPRRP